MKAPVTIDLKHFRKLPIIEATLNGKPAHFILDSGATFSVLNLNDKTAYDFDSEEDDENEAVGYGGQAAFEKAKYVEVTVGGVKLNGDFNAQDLSKIVGVIKSNEGVTVNGIIGVNFFTSYGFILDFKNYKITLHP